MMLFGMFVLIISYSLCLFICHMLLLSFLSLLLCHDTYCYIHAFIMTMELRLSLYQIKEPWIVPYIYTYIQYDVAALCHSNRIILGVLWFTVTMSFGWMSLKVVCNLNWVHANRPEVNLRLHVTVSAIYSYIEK